MKKAVFLGLVLFVLFDSCTQKSKEPADVNKTGNTLKSVSLLYDSTGVEPSRILALVETMNKVIDSIGYPDAGYKLWLIKGDSVKDFKFMLEGNWPDQAIYDTIHNNAAYKNAWNSEASQVWKEMKLTFYNKFTLVK